MAQAAVEQGPVDKSWRDLLADGRLPRFALICLGVWLNAADSLVTATIMPSVGAQLGGYAYFSWATAGYFVGAILAGASSGRLSEMFGLRAATTIAGLIMVGGCVMSALAPGVGVFLAGRLVQGVGSGWISGFAMVAIAQLFPDRHWARVFASVTFIWGIATILGPLFGGVVVQTGDWRDVFWLFALQAGAFSAAAPLLLSGSTKAGGGPGIPWTQLAILGAGVAAIAVADVVKGPAVSTGLVVAGLAILALVMGIDGRLRVRLFPHRAADLTTVCGAGYFAMFTLTAASMGFSIYGPPILQAVRGFSPLWAGYAIGAESMAWTVAAMSVSHAGPTWDARWIRLGAVMLTVSLVILALTMADGPLAWMLIGGALMGAAFGFAWAFMSRRLLAALSDEDRAIGSSAITAVRQTGAAAGAAISGVAANLAGFSEGLTAETARAASPWVFVSVIPLALVGAWGAFRLTGSAERV
jgi:MFS family permease